MLLCCLLVVGGGGLYLRYHLYEQRRSELSDALLIGRVNRARSLLAQGIRLNADAIQIQFRNVVSYGHVESAELLLELAAAVDRPYAGDGMNWTPLMVATQLRNPAGVRFLLERGANVMAVDSTGRNALALLRADTASQKRGGPIYAHRILTSCELGQ